MPEFPGLDLQLTELQVQEVEAIFKLSYLPTEIWEKIIQFISWRERFRLEAVCKRWKKLMPYSDVTEFAIIDLQIRSNYVSFLDNALRSVLPRCGRYLTSISVSKGSPLHVSVSSIAMIKKYCVGLEKLNLRSCIIQHVDVLSHIPPTVKYFSLPGVPDKRFLDDGVDINPLYRRGLSELLNAKPDLLSLELDGFLPGTVIPLPHLLHLSILENSQGLGSGSGLTSEDMERICQNCRSLQELNLLARCQVDLKMGPSIGQLVQLRSLSLRNVSVTKEALQALYSNCTQLISIHFNACKLVNDYKLPPLVVLESLPELAALKLDNCSVHDAVVMQMVRSGKLREVIINGNRIAFATMLSVLQVNPFLENVKVHCDADGLGDFTDILRAGLSLRSLYLKLDGRGRGRITILDSAFIRPLQKLTLHWVTINDDAVRALSKVCPEMNELVLRGCNIVAVEGEVPEFPMLKYLSIDGYIDGYINTSSLTGICQGAKLQSLSLLFEHWPHGALTTITEHCPELTSLSLFVFGISCDIRVEDISSALQNVPGLEKLSLESNSQCKTEESEFDLGGAIATHGLSLTSLILRGSLDLDILVISLALHRSQLIDSGIELPSLEVKCHGQSGFVEKCKDLSVTVKAKILFTKF